MYIFGHLGCGLYFSKKVVTHISQKYQPNNDFRTYGFGWLIIGCLAPDLIDKPLHLLNNLLPVSLPAINGDKSIGHTIIFAFVIFLASKWKTSYAGQLFSVGIGSHIILDLVSDISVSLMGTNSYSFNISSLHLPNIASYFWPVLTFEFPESSQATIGDYWKGILNPLLIIYEIIGFILFSTTIAKNRFNPCAWLNQLSKRLHLRM